MRASSKGYMGCKWPAGREFETPDLQDHWRLIAALRGNEQRALTKPC